jgi:nucleotide-binding universal stress UspA family protein
MTARVSSGGQRRVVVGVDGSVPSKAALTWAARQAELTGAVVDAVLAWQDPLFFRTPWPAAAMTDFKDLAEHRLADAIASVADSVGQAEIRPRVVEGNAPQVLLDAAAGADLLVVGSRGYGGFTEALLGSVSQHCVHHATCPVVIIRDSHAGPGEAP